MATRTAITLALAVALFGSAAQAHQASVTYVDVALVGHTVRVTLDVAGRDLVEPLGLDPATPLTPVAVSARQDRLLDYLTARVHVTNGQATCAPADRGLSFAARSGGFFAVAQVDYRCRRTPSAVAITYDLFFDLDPLHRGLAQLHLPQKPVRQHVFSAGARTLHLDRPLSLFDDVGDFLVLGMEHIFTGYDHIAFLLALLLVAARYGLRGGLRYTFGIVTAFTVAHSLTLTAAGLNLVRLPGRVVEPAIAFSIAYVAAENLLVEEPRHRWLLTFGFGLVHGFGFASVLQELGLPSSAVIPSLFSFNLGVELGQLCVVLVAAPLLLWLVPRRGAAAPVRRIGSLVLLALSSLWFFERIVSG